MSRPDPVVASELADLVAVVRSLGMAVGVDAVAVLTAAVAELDAAGGGSVSASGLYWAGRCTLTTGADDVERYDRAFAQWVGAGGETVTGGTTTTTTGDDGRGGAGLDGPGDTTTGIPGDGASGIAGPDDGTRSDSVHDVPLGGVWSPVETLRRRDLAALDDRERAEAWALIDRLARVGGRRRHPRWAPAARGPVDLRSTVRAAMASGEVLAVHRRRRTERARPIVVLIDVSGSMDAYARSLVRLAHAWVATGRRVEVFALGTRLTRLTHELAGRDPDVAMERAAAAVADWSGGTRLGDTIGEFVARWGRRGMARGAEVVILSDGWDRGDPGELAEAMAALARLAHRVVWANPLRGDPAYEPLTRGMAAALPYCDRLVDGHSIASFDDLASVLAP